MRSRILALFLMTFFLTTQYAFAGLLGSNWGCGGCPSAGINSYGGDISYGGGAGNVGCPQPTSDVPTYTYCYAYKPYVYYTQKWHSNCVAEQYQVPYTRQECQWVPQYYQKTYCYYEPKYYTKTFCKQVPQYYSVQECRTATRYKQVPYCTYEPHYFYRCEKTNPCATADTGVAQPISGGAPYGGAPYGGGAPIDSGCGCPSYGAPSIPQGAPIGGGAPYGGGCPSCPSCG